MADRFTYRVWDGVSEINGIPESVWREEHKMHSGQLGYIVYRDGVMTHFQAWNPFESGFVEMSSEDIDNIAEKHVNVENERDGNYINYLTDDRIINMASSNIIEMGVGVGSPSYASITLNNDNPKLVTKLCISKFTFYDVNISGILSMVETGNRIQIRDKVKGTSYYVYSVVGRPSVSENYLEIEVEWAFGEGLIDSERVLLNIRDYSGRSENKISYRFNHSVPSGPAAGRHTMQVNHPARRLRDSTFLNTNGTSIKHKYVNTNSKEVIWLDYSGRLWEGNLDNGECRILYDLRFSLNSQGMCDVCYFDGRYYMVLSSQGSTLFILDEDSKILTQSKTPVSFNKIFGVAGREIILHNSSDGVQLYAYNIDTELVRVLNTKPSGNDFKWNNSAMHMYNGKLFVLSFGSSKLSWYYDFNNDLWKSIAVEGLPQLTHTANTAIDYDTGNFYCWSSGRVDRVNLNNLVYSSAGSIDWIGGSYMAIYYKGMLTTFQAQFMVGDEKYRMSTKFPWSNFPNGRYRHDTEGWFWYFSANGQIYRVNWEIGVIRVIWSVFRQNSDMYSTYGGLTRCMALAERDGKLYIAGQYPFMVDVETGEGKLITINGVVVTGPTAGEASFAARLGDTIVMVGVGVTSENTSFNRIIRVFDDGTAEYCPSTWVNTSTDTNYNLIVYEEEGLVSRAANSASSVSRYNLLSNSAGSDYGFPISTTAGLATFYNYRTKSWYSLFATDISLANEGTLLLPNEVAGWASPTMLNIAVNPDRGYVIAFNNNLIYMLPESVCVRKIGKVLKGQVLEFNVEGTGSGMSCMMVGRKRYYPGRSIIEDDGDLWSCIYPGGALSDRFINSKFLSGWVEEA